MGLTLNTVFLRTPTGILKILEIVFVFACLFMCRFGGERSGTIFFVGANNYGEHFLAVGIFVGYAIIVPAVLITYLMGANLTFLELFVNLIGAILYITVGVLCMTHYKGAYGHNHKMGIALGIMSIIAGVLFLIDFLFAIKNTRITIIQTRTTVVA